MELTGPRTVTILAQINFTTIFRVIVGGQIANFGKKNPSSSFNGYKRMT